MKLAMLGGWWFLGVCGLGFLKNGQKGIAVVIIVRDKNSLFYNLIEQTQIVGKISKGRTYIVDMKIYTISAIFFKIFIFCEKS